MGYPEASSFPQSTKQGVQQEGIILPCVLLVGLYLGLVCLKELLIANGGEEAEDQGVERVLVKAIQALGALNLLHKLNSLQEGQQ